MERNSFIFYKGWREAIKDLPDDVRLEIYESISEYATTGNLRGLKPMANIAFNFIKIDIDRDTEKYMSIVERNKSNGSKGGRPKSENPKEPKEPTKPTGLFGNPKEPTKPDNDNEYDNDNVNELKESIEKRHFVPPTTQDVAAYCKEKGITTVDAERFVDFYSSKGWMVGKNKMKDWKAAVRNWGRKDAAAEPNNTKGNKFTNFEQRSYDYRELEGKLLAAGKE